MPDAQERIIKRPGMPNTSKVDVTCDGYKILRATPGNGNASVFYVSDPPHRHQASPTPVV